jgi:acyl-CoA dehydrogenase
MGIDFSVDEDAMALRDEVAAFVRRSVVPAEQHLGDGEPGDDLRRELQSLARSAGLLSPHVSSRFGGRGLSHRERALVFEEAGYSPLGPLALNVAAPDEGNAHLLDRIGTEAQQERWLAPLARGDIRSCFAMTERPPGAGSDPRAIRTTAVRDGGEHRISGEKWMITGAAGAAVCLVLARTGSDERGLPEATIFLVPTDAPGFRIERAVTTLDRASPGGHSIVVLDDVRVGRDGVVGEVGQGFRHAQVRLVPARLTHCMRWLGAARRSQDIAVKHAGAREAFGHRLIDHEGVGFMLADNEIDLHAARLMVWHAAWLLDTGADADVIASMAKVRCSETVWSIVDRCVQVLGALGTTDDQVVARFLRDARGFRIYDGPSEVHRWRIARRLSRDGVDMRTPQGAS